MGGLFDSLTVGGNALDAQQYGAQITGTNIANVNVPGYHRQDVIMNSGSLEGGVQTTYPQRAVQTLLEENANAQASAYHFAHTRQEGLVRLQGAMGDLGATGVGAQLADFFASWRAVSASPQDVASRNNVLSRLQNLLTNFNTTAQNLTQQVTDADNQVVQTVNAANTQITNIAKLNAQIIATESAGNNANDLRDQRDESARELARTVGAQSFIDNRGNVNILVGEGVSLVSGSNATLLTTQADANTGLHHVVPQNTTQGPLDSRITAGTLGGLLHLRDVDLATNQAALDQMAYDLAQNVNTIHAAGFGLDGVTGRNLIAVNSLSGAATTITTDPNVAGNANALAAAQSPAALPGDNTNANAMIALQNSLVAQGNSLTLQQEWSVALGSLGNTVATVNQDYTHTQGLMNNTRALAEQQIGVSIEDQMLQLQRYQSAYQAATKLVTTINSMLQSLTNM